MAGTRTLQQINYIDDLLHRNTPVRLHQITQRVVGKGSAGDLLCDTNRRHGLSAHIQRPIGIYTNQDGAGQFRTDRLFRPCGRQEPDDAMIGKTGSKHEEDEQYKNDVHQRR